jgi:hypothetical protein
MMLTAEPAWNLPIVTPARLVGSTGCHDFGLAPGSHYLGLDAATCTFEPRSSVLKDIPWRSVDVFDIQAQRMLGDRCMHLRGLDAYISAVTHIASWIQRRDPDIAVATQVSFRDNPPQRMLEAVASVARVVDGIYFSYPTRHTDAVCEYCSAANIRVLLEYLRG